MIFTSSFFQLTSVLCSLSQDNPSIKSCLPKLETASNIYPEYILYHNIMLIASKIQPALLAVSQILNIAIG